VLSAAIAVAAGGCVTPSIPVPPPDPQQMTFQIDTTGGTASFSYKGNPNLAGDTVYVFDRRVGQGVIDTAHVNGSVGPTPSFVAAAGDDVDVTFQQGDQAESTCVVLQAGTPSSICF
jgi:hypothetical protein